MLRLKGAIIEMLDGVVECLVPRKKTVGVYIARFLVFLFDAALAALSLIIFVYFTSYYAIDLVFLGIGIFATWLVIRNTNIEYEYAFFEGDFSVDKIINKSKRKRLKRVNFSKMDVMAPAGSKRLGGNPDSKAVKLNYSALDDDYKDYVAVVFTDDGKRIEIKFSPSEELLDVLKRKYPRRIYED